MNPSHDAPMSSTHKPDRLEGLIKLLASDADNKSLRGRCVSLALQECRYDAASKLVEEALARDPLDRQALFEQASIHLAQKQFDTASRLLAALTEDANVDPAVWQNLGLCHYALGDYAAAKPCLERVYERGAHSADLFRLLVSTLHHLGLVDEALVVAKTAAESGRANGALAGVLALLYLDAEEPAQAARWSARALALNPQSVDGLVVQGTLRTGAFDLPTARGLFMRALAAAPETARAWLGLSLVSLAENDFTQARDQIQTGLRYMPQHVGSWHVLAWIDLIQGKLDEAQVSFERSLDLDRNFAESHGGLAAIAALRGDRATADERIEIAERLDPTCLSAKFARSTLIKGAGDPKAAREVLLTALTGLSPQDSGAVARVIGELTRH